MSRGIEAMETLLATGSGEATIIESMSNVFPPTPKSTLSGCAAESSAGLTDWPENDGFWLLVTTVVVVAMLATWT